MLGWTVSCSVFWVNIDTTRYSATEFGRNKATNFRLSGTLRGFECKYRESVDRLKKSKILITCQKNTFGELSSKILFKLSRTLLFLGSFAQLIMQKSGSKLNKLRALAFKQFATL